MPAQAQQPDNLRASVIDRFRKVAIAPDQERKFPVGPESAMRLGYDPAEVDALYPLLPNPSAGWGTHSFWDNPCQITGCLTWDAVPVSTPSWRLRWWVRTARSSAWT